MHGHSTEARLTLELDARAQPRLDERRQGKRGAQLASFRLSRSQWRCQHTVAHGVISLTPVVND